jgi:hypothetical protein
VCGCVCAVYHYERRVGRSASTTFDSVYDKIQNSSSYPDSLKNIATTLAKTINEISNAQVDALNGYYYSGNTSPTPLEDGILHPKTSTNVNVRSRLICVAGKNKDLINQCE